jgi:hypothetical protein
MGSGRVGRERQGRSASTVGVGGARAVIEDPKHQCCYLCVQEEARHAFLLTHFQQRGHALPWFGTSEPQSRFCRKKLGDQLADSGKRQPGRTLSQQQGIISTATSGTTQSARPHSALYLEREATSQEYDQLGTSPIQLVGQRARIRHNGSAKACSSEITAKESATIARSHENS